MTTIAALRDTPYAADKRRSVERRFVQPKGLGELLAWFLREWSDEVPSTVHMRGVWHDFVRYDEDRQSVGGSLIGAPALAGEFRRYTENSANEIDQDGSYARPMHRALVTMAGRTPGTNSAFMARYLFAIAHAAGDISTVAARFGLRPEIVDVYTEAALFRLWSRWQPNPR